MKMFWKSALVASAVACYQIAGPARAEPLTIGMMLPYTGVYAALGEEIETGFRLAIKQNNDTGHTIDIVQEDSEAKAAGRPSQGQEARAGGQCQRPRGRGFVRRARRDPRFRR